MKRILVMTLLLLVALSGVSGAAGYKDIRQIGVVMLGSPLGRTEQSCNYVQGVLAVLDSDYRIKTGRKMQEAFSQYMLEKGYEASSLPNEEAMKDFVTYNEKDAVIYFYVSDPVTFVRHSWWFREDSVYRSYLGIRGYLCTADEVKEVCRTSGSGMSEASPAAAAREALEKALKSAGSSTRPLLQKEKKKIS